MQSIIQLVWLLWMTFMKDQVLKSHVASAFFGTNTAHEYLDYHWVGGVTSSTASVKITLLPSVAEHADELYSLSLVLIEAKSNKVLEEVWF